MTTLVELNAYASGTISFTDNRPSDVKFSYPTARDITKVLTDQTFAVERLIDIIEVIKPVEANVRYSIDVSTVPGATVNWTSIPSGCSVSVYNQVYTIDGIDSKEVWDQVAAPIITVPATFFGSFFYFPTIYYTNGSEPKSKSWQVGLFLPEINCESNATLTCQANKVFGGTNLSFAMETNFQAVIQDYLLVQNFVIRAQFTAGYYSPAATLTCNATITEAGEVSPQPFAPYLTLQNPNSDTTNTIDGYSVDVAIDDNYVLVGARNEDDATYDDAGVAYVFNKSTGALIRRLDNPNPGPFVELFGTSVALTDNYFVVGAPQEDTADSGPVDGSVYVFNKSDGTLAQTITGGSSGNSTYFGMNIRTIDSANDIVVVSEPGSNSVYYNVDCDTGTLGSSRTQTDLVDNNNPSNQLASNGNGRWIAGAPRQKTAYIYNSGTLEYTLSETDTSTNPDGAFGATVAISDNYFAVGGWDTNNNQGTIWIGRLSDGNILGQINDFDVGNLLSTDNSQFGYRIEMNDTFTFVSTKRSVKQDVRGRVWVFNTQTQQQVTGKKIYPPDTLSDTANPPSYYPGFGQTFAFDGTDKLAVGTYNSDNEQYVYLYDID